jgi:uncharacterized cofD-like protein
MKKIVIFGGGSGLSQLLKGLKLFPVEITAVVTVADNGKSTGRLRKELNIPAVGDISKVLLSMSDADQDVIDLMNYRFTKSSSIGNHSVKNLLLTALLDLNGDFESSIKVLGKLMNIKGTVLPLTDDSIDLVGINSKGKLFIGEEKVHDHAKEIVELTYNKDFKLNKNIYKAIDDADLIIFSSGSLYTSILPHLINKDLANYIKKAKAKKMYICNLFTQPNETENYTASDHIKLIERYLGKDGIDIILVNNHIINSDLAKKYLADEQKDFVVVDENELRKMHKKIISDDLVTIENNYFRHDSLKTGYLIFSCLMDDVK